jgi:hypothetical protein
LFLGTFVVTLARTRMLMLGVESRHVPAPDTALSQRDVTGKCALKIAVKHAKSGTMIQMEDIILP